MIDVKHNIKRAQSWVILNATFFASVLLHLNIVEDISAETAWTDSVTIGYNPEFIKELSIAELNTVLCHEVMHVALLHSFRRENRDMKVWNIACDYVINGILKKSNYTLPAMAYQNTDYDGMSEEAVYALLMKNQKKENDNGGDGGGKGKNSKGSPGKDGRGIGDVRDYEPKNGTAANGDKKDKEPIVGGNAYSEGKSEKEQSTKIMVQQAMIASSMQGDMPGDLKRMIQDILTPVIPWREMLARFVTENSSNDYTWKMPSSRYTHMGMYLPTLHTPSLGTIAVMIDTSGSVTSNNLDRYASELQSILASYPDTTIEVIYCDAAVSSTETLDAYSFDLHPTGGGGTDYRPPFKYIEDSGILPVCAIYFTDGECTRFPSRPEYEVMWIINGGDKFSPPFGEVTFVKD